MASVLYYWRRDNYLRDKRFGFGYHLNQNSPAIAQLQRDDTVWAFTRDVHGRYVLAAALVVRTITRNPANYRYGKHRVWGDLERSRYFDLHLSPNAEDLIRSFHLRTGAAVLGRSFQGHSAVRALSSTDEALLTTFAADLPELDRVGIYPEDEFEARLLVASSIREFMVRESRAEYDARLEYLYDSVNVTRTRRLVEELHNLYVGRCQVCMFDPRTMYSGNLCHGHHVQWLSRGGDDALENLVLVCPNHHAAVHRFDATFDYADLTFRYDNGKEEPVRLNFHLPLAA